MHPVSKGRFSLRRWGTTQMVVYAFYKKAIMIANAAIDLL
jgi:hypothetical protein